MNVRLLPSIATTLLLASAFGCGAARAKVESRVRPADMAIDGSLLLASPGVDVAGGVATPLWLTGAPGWIVRGRVRWHVESDGSATRANEVTSAPIVMALSLPAWLGGGALYMSAGGLWHAASTGGRLRALAATDGPQGLFDTWSIGADAVYARLAGLGDLHRIDPKSGAITIVDADATGADLPITAPLMLPTQSSRVRAGGRSAGVGELLGDQAAGGPEHVSPRVGYALVELLGLVRTTDGGASWTRTDSQRLRAAMYGANPSQLVRLSDGVGVMGRLAPFGGDVIAPLTPNGMPTTAFRAERTRTVAVPDVASIAVEQALLSGVRQPDGNVLVFDRGRLALVGTRPIRVLRASPIADAVSCELRPSARAMAMAVCEIFEGELRGVVGEVRDDGDKLTFVSDRSFNAGVGREVGPTGALRFDATCDRGSSRVGVFCVRALDGSLHEHPVPPSVKLLASTPLSDGRLLFTYDVAPGRLAFGLSNDGAAVGVPLSGALDRARLLAMGEVRPGVVALWMRTETHLFGIRVDLARDRITPTLTLSQPLADRSLVGAYGDHALIVRQDKPVPVAPDGSSAVVVGAIEQASIDSSTTTNVAWPQSAKAIEHRGSPLMQCAPMGCSFFGWNRIGWSPGWAHVDDVASLDGAPSLPKPTAAPPAMAKMFFKCLAAGEPESIPKAKLPAPRGEASWGDTPALVSMGAPLPVVGKNDVLIGSGFRSPGMRGGLLGWGPRLGAWRGTGTAILRWASDVDPFGTMYETSPSRAPYESAYPNITLLAHPLGPGRLLAAVHFGPVGWGASIRRLQLFRASAGKPLEPLDLGIEDASFIYGAREIDERLFVVGRRGDGESARVFSATIDQGAVHVETLGPIGARETYDSSAWTDPQVLFLGVDASSDRMGIVLPSRWPSSAGGATWVLPLDAAGAPSEGFLRYKPLDPLRSAATTACRPGEAGWEVARRVSYPKSYVEIGGKLTEQAFEVGVLRTKLRSDGACLSHVTLLGNGSGLQLEPYSGRATLQRTSASAGESRALSCTVRFTAE